MNTLPDKGVIISRVLTDQKVVGSSPAGCTSVTVCRIAIVRNF